MNMRLRGWETKDLSGEKIFFEAQTGSLEMQ